MNKEKWITRKEFAERMSVSVSTFNRLLADDKFDIPQGIKLGSGEKPVRRWPESVVNEFMSRNNA